MKIRIGRRLLKKFLLLLTLALLLLAFPAPGLASQPVTVTLDGEALGFDVPPVLEKGRVLVPLRGIFEALGSKVDWNGASRTVTATAGSDPSTGQSRFLKLTVGQKMAYLSGQPVELDAPARIINSRILVPVRFVAEALGAQVDWQAPARSLHASFEQLTPLRNWYEDVKFLVRPVGNVAEVVKDEAASRTTWVQGRHGWYVDEEATETLKTMEMAQMPDIFSLTPLSPPGYAWVLVKDQ